MIVFSWGLLCAVQKEGSGRDEVEGAKEEAAQVSRSVGSYSLRVWRLSVSRTKALVPLDTSGLLN